MMRRRGADVIWRSSWVVDQDWLARGSKPHRDSKWMVEEWLVSESIIFAGKKLAHLRN